MSPNKTLIDVQNVSKTYQTPQGPIHALNGVSLSIGTGEVVGLLGVNGAGKTTLSHIIATLHPPTEGDVLYKGTSIYKNVPAYRMHIGLCPQHSNLNPDLSLEQNLVFSGMAYRQDAHTAHTRAHELMSHFGLMNYANQKSRILSGGYKQRFSLARSLMHRPKLVILDEPTVGLDPHIRHQLWEYITDLKKGGTSILLTTHYIEEAEKLSDRVCVLDKGVVKLMDTPENLKASFKQSTLESVFLELIKQSEKENA